MNLALFPNGLSGIWREMKVIIFSEVILQVMNPPQNPSPTSESLHFQQKFKTCKSSYLNMFLHFHFPELQLYVYV